MYVFLLTKSTSRQIVQASNMRIIDRKEVEKIVESGSRKTIRFAKVGSEVKRLNQMTYEQYKEVGFSFDSEKLRQYFGADVNKHANVFSFKTKPMKRHEAGGVYVDNRERLFAYLGKQEGLHVYIRLFTCMTKNGTFLLSRQPQMHYKRLKNKKTNLVCKSVKYTITIDT